MLSFLNKKQKIKNIKEKELNFEAFFDETVAQYKAQTQDNIIEWPLLCHMKKKSAMACVSRTLAHLSQLPQHISVAEANKQRYEGRIFKNYRHKRNQQNVNDTYPVQGFSKNKLTNPC